MVTRADCNLIVTWTVGLINPRTLKPKLSLKPIPMTEKQESGKPVIEEVVFQLDQSGVAARPCVTKSRSHET